MTDTEEQVTATIPGTESGDEQMGMQVVEEDQMKQLGGQAEDKNDLQQNIQTDQKEGDNTEEKAEDPPKEEKPMIEVFIGGLSPTIEDEAVMEAVGKVVEGASSIRVARRKRNGECRGWAILKVPDIESAQKLCEELKAVDGRLVGVHVSRRKALDPSGFPYYPTEKYRPLELPVEDCSLKQLFDKVRGSVDKQGLVLSTIRGIYYPRPYWEEEEDDYDYDEEYDEGEENVDGTSGSPPMKKRKKDDQDTSEIDEIMRKDCPGCMKILNKYRSLQSSGSNKTALAILNEYAARTNMKIQYEEEVEAESGMFKCQAKLSRNGNANVLYAQGNGSGRSKT
eukprot:TRINITY_DN3014_c2_g1_i1.p1 TRINITY_DN3014_c2_g1~~TRINITY_DN3014_c2_g1_i1.p1  ORF type:complete len:338 (-),score=64.21 TRINITY_DN3014_c2_g1_i1:87-1100(-)